LNHISSVALPGPSRYADFATILELGNNSRKVKETKAETKILSTWQEDMGHFSYT